MAKKSDKVNFARSFEELEEIVKWFEGSEADLEEGLGKFERGLELAQECRGRLKEVENKVIKIKAKFSELGDESEEKDESEEQGHLL